MIIYEERKRREYRTISLLFLFGLFLVPVIIYAYATSNMNIQTNIYVNEKTDTDKEHFINPDQYTFLPVEPIIENDLPVCQTLTDTALSADNLELESFNPAFFENSVFVGDSISVGFEKYCQAGANSIKTDSTYFLARVSCSAKAVISPNATTKYANVMPMYKEKVQLVEDSIAQIGNIEKVFICFGVNDLVGCSPEEYINNIQILVENIKAKNPDVSIYMLSIPCVYADVTTGYLNNASIREANHLLYNTCVEKEWGFINITEYLMDSTFAIRSELSSDGYVHENNAAYDIWTKVLKNYAR